MHSRTPLSTDQIEQLKIELNKIQDRTLTSFAQKATVALTHPHHFHFDSFYQFAVREHETLIRELQNVLRFAFSILSNFEVLWEEVFFRDTKLTELRETFSSATGYIEELKEQNYELKKKLSEAETYIEWIQQQKQCLDAIYQDRYSNSTAPSNKNLPMSRCVSESSLRWSGSRVKDNLTFEKLKDYIDRLREERNQYQSQLVTLNKRYELKCQENKKANLFIQHLVERINRRHQRQYTDITNFSMNSPKDSSRSEFITDDILQILERNESPSQSTSLKNLIEIDDEQYQRKQGYCKYNPSFKKLDDTSFKQFNQAEPNFSTLQSAKQTKDVQIVTESQLLRCQTVQTQTENKENKNKQKKIDYKISIHITGDQNEEIHFQNVLKDLQLQKKIETKIKSKILKTDKQKACDKKQPKQENKSSRIGQILEYYHQRWVSNRIKKYSFQKPDTKPIYKFYKK